MKKHKVAAIVPAFNEAPRIGDVLTVLTRADVLDEVIVVDDGSSDMTSTAAAKFPVKVIRMSENLGKGAAMRRGADSTDADILAFIDADLIGLEVRHVESLVEPISRFEKIDMVTARFTEGRLATNLSQRITPILNSQRAIRRRFLDTVPDFSRSRFGVETIITTYARRTNAEVVDVEFDGVTQVMKEEKMGPIKGVRSRFDMYKDIFKHRYTSTKDE